MEKFYGSIDIGTTRIKARLYDSHFNVVFARDIDNPTIQGWGGAVEQDPGFIASTVRGLARELVERGTYSIGISTYRGSLVVWDEAGQPKTNVMTWMDVRPHRYYGRLPLGVRASSRLPLIGQAFTPESMAIRLATLKFIDEGVWRGVRSGELYAWNIDAFISYTIIKRYCSDASNATLTGLIHPRTLKPIGFVLSRLGFRAVRLPGVICHDRPLGYLTGASLGPTIGDQQASSIALRCIDKGCLKISMGTGLFLDYATGGELHLGKGLVPLILMCRKAEALYGVEAYATGLGKAVEWFVESMMGGDYNVFNESIREDPGKLVVSPYIWGLRKPRVRWGVSGMLGISPGTGIGDVANSLAHSIAATALLLYREVTRMGRPSRIIVTGGLTRASNLVRLIASYIGREVEVYSEGDDSALGAALVSAWSIGDNVDVLVRTSVVEPDPHVTPMDVDEMMYNVKRIEALLK